MPFFKKPVPICQMDSDGKILKHFNSISLAVIHLKGIVSIKNQSSAESAISNCLAGRQKTAFGYKWIKK